MQALRLIHQSFIRSIKTGNPWDFKPQAAEYPHLVIKDGLACLTLSSATRTHTQMLSPWHGQPESRLNLSRTGFLTAMQQFSSMIQILKNQEIWNGSCTFILRRLTYCPFVLVTLVLIILGMCSLF